MSALAACRVVVAGAGVVGTAIAFSLARAGAAVTLVDPAEVGDNASGVAAGMLAPAFEAVLDEASASHFDLLRAARDRWPSFAEPLAADRIGLRRSGGLWVATPGDPGSLVQGRQRALERLGAAFEALSPADVRRLAPALRDEVGPGLFTAEDWVVEPRMALDRLRAAAIDAGVAAIAQRLVGFDSGVARLADGESLPADHLVVATGADASGLAAELDHLAPIKGHILHFPTFAAADSQPAIRCSGGYALDGPSGLRVGATMEPGLSDRQIDADAVEGLRRLAVGLYPGLEGVQPVARAGVRAATPDGLPLVGPSRSPGVCLAVGVRRNGWLLAPMIAEMATAYLAGRDPGPFAARFDPQRYG